MRIAVPLSKLARELRDLDDPHSAALEVEMNCRPLLIVSLMFPVICDAKIPPAEFVELMEKHRARLVTLALMTSSAHRDEFGAISPELIERYLRLHDMPKVQSLQVLKTYGYEREKSIAEQLAEVYGSNIRDMGANDRLALQTTIDSLNFIEKTQKQALFDQEHLTDQQKHQLERLERIVDVTDTGIARAEEMGIKRSPYDGSNYLLAHDHDVHAAQISRWVEDHYTRILYPMTGSCESVLMRR